MASKFIGHVWYKWGRYLIGLYMAWYSRLSIYCGPMQHVISYGLPFNKGKTYFTLWTHKKHIIARPDGRAMVRPLWVACKKWPQDIESALYSRNDCVMCELLTDNLTKWQLSKGDIVRGKSITSLVNASQINYSSYFFVIKTTSSIIYWQQQYNDCLNWIADIS